MSEVAIMHTESTNNMPRLAVLQIERSLDVIIERTRAARDLYEIDSIRDIYIQAEAYLQTKAAAESMGRKVDLLREDLKSIRLLADVRQGELTARLSSAERSRVLAAHGIDAHKARVCESAARVPRPVLDKLLDNHKAKGESPPPTHLVARLAAKSYRSSAIESGHRRIEKGATIDRALSSIASAENKAFLKKYSESGASARANEKNKQDAEAKLPQLRASIAKQSRQLVSLASSLAKAADSVANCKDGARSRDMVALEERAQSARAQIVQIEDTLRLIQGCEYYLSN